MPARSKSFTGCWTCRARKIKCDLAQPSCKQCLKTKLKCEGYSIKLRWTHEGADPGHDRRNVDFVEFPANMMYDFYDDIDKELIGLNHVPVSGAETKVAGPFGVFEGIQQRSVVPESRKRKRRDRTSIASTPSDKSREQTPETSASASGSGTNPASTPNTSMDGIPHRRGPNSKPPTGANTPMGMQTGANTPTGLPTGTNTPTGLGRVSSQGQMGHFQPQALDKIGQIGPIGTMGQVSQPLRSQSVNNVGHMETLTRPMFDDPSFLAAADTGAGSGPFLFDPNQDMEGMEQALLSYFPDNYMEPLQSELLSEESSLVFEPGKPGSAQKVPQDEPFTLGNSPTFIAQARYLLWHYNYYVTPHMTFVVHSKNPWKTIYLPRAYAAVADIVVDGRTSDERYTLLYTFLAISAYHIRNKYAEGTPFYAFYDKLGSRLQNVAKSWLSASLHSEANAKYKELLVALLSMITLDLVKGQESTVLVPLGAAQHLINLRYHRKPRLSRKAKILHRICVMLTLLQKSSVVGYAEGALGAEKSADGDEDTAAWMDKTFDDAIDADTNHQVAQIEQLGKLQSRNVPLSYMDDQVQLEEYFDQYQGFDAPTALPDDAAQIPNDYEAVSTQLIHGVPDSLVYIFKQVVDVSRRALHQREKLENHGRLGPELSAACTHIEALLASWKSKFEVTKPTDLLVPAVNEAVMHHSLAVHEALVVYHYRIAKDVNRALLQPVVERVIDHLEAITKLNGDNRNTIVALPFLFAGFICGCEVVTENKSLRTRFDLWFRDMRATGLSTYETAIKVTNEVNRRRAEGQPSNWWDIVREWDLTLILI